MTLYDDSKARPRSLSVRELSPGVRPQSRLERDGTGGLSEAELLALVLGGDDGLAVAYDILKDCGRVDYLTRYDIEELGRLPGVGKARAGRVLAAVELGRRVTRPREYDILTSIHSPGDAANLLMPDMMHLRQEQLKVVLMDTRNQVLGVRLIYQGTQNTIQVRVAEIIRPAIVTSAAAIIVSHNHPSGDPSPSPEDIRISRLLTSAGNDLGIAVLDHIIIGNGRYVSLRERGLMGDDSTGKGY